MRRAIQIIKRLQDNGHHALLVGGSVRDRLLKKIPKDYDIVSSATPDEIEILFDRVKPVGKQFGIMLVDNEYEVAAFRVDHYEGSDLTVNLLDPSTHTLEELIEKDSAKRDFTIGAIYHDPIADITYDPVGGVDDLNNRRLRFVGTPANRIKEDPLRILRGFRFSMKYNTNQPTCISQEFAKDLSTVAPERIFQEMTKCLMNINNWNLDTFRAFTNITRLVCPHLCIEDKPQSPMWHPEGFLVSHVFQALKQLRVVNEVTVWAIYLHDVGKHTKTVIEEDGRITAKQHELESYHLTLDVLKSLKCSNKFIDEVTYIVGQHMRIKHVTEMKKSKIISLMHHKYFENLKEVSCADSMSSIGNIAWWHFLNEYKQVLPTKQEVKPLVTGDDLINELGIKPGPIFKEILSLFYDVQIEQGITDRRAFDEYFDSNKDIYQDISDSITSLMLIASEETGE